MALPRSSPVQFRLNGTDINFKFWWAAVDHDTDRAAMRFAPCCNPKEMTKGISHYTALQFSFASFPRGNIQVSAKISSTGSGLKTA